MGTAGLYWRVAEICVGKSTVFTVESGFENWQESHEEVDVPSEKRWWPRQGRGGVQRREGRLERH